MFGFFKSRRRQRLLANPLPAESRTIIERNVAVCSLLSPAEQQRLFDAVKIIIAERVFVGLKGVSISPEQQLTIAAQAALLLLGEEGYYFDRVAAIYVQPTHHTTRAVRDLGSAVLVEDDVLVEGQAYERDGIRLAWDEVLYGSRDPADGENVVLHEFAHHLDALDGAMDGMPPLASENERRKWQTVFDAVLADHRRDLAQGREVFLHDEAAENRAELLAYSTELFFEQPLELAEWHPELFDCLHAFYKVDPRVWFSNDGATEGRRDRAS
jgi:Mlc titration factor MtfA (ptsG expression regulator)